MQDSDRARDTGRARDAEPARAAEPARDPLDRALGAIDLLLRLGAWVGALAALGLAFMLIAEVILTSFFSWSQPWAVEYAAYLLGLVLFVGTGWTLGQGGHIRVEVLASAIGPRAMRWVDLAGSVFGLGVVGFVALALVGQAWRTGEIGSRSYFPSETPLVYPQALLALGFVFLALAFLARVVRLATGRPAETKSELVGGIE